MLTVQVSSLSVSTYPYKVWVRNWTARLIHTSLSWRSVFSSSVSLSNSAVFDCSSSLALSRSVFMFVILSSSSADCCQQTTSPIITAHFCLSEWVDSNGTSAQLGYIQCHSRRFMQEIQDRRQIKNRHTTKTKHNQEKANNAKYSRTKLGWFSHLIRHSARKQGGLILQCSRAHMEHTFQAQRMFIHPLHCTW